MNFGLGGNKQDRPIGPEHMKVSEGFYGVPDVMATGLVTQAEKLVPGHPLTASEKTYHDNKLRTRMNMMRNTQGLHAPLKLGMELKAARQVGRLPFLPSSNLMTDVLLGRDDEISFEDFLNPTEFREEMGQPHAVVEKSLGIL